MFKSFFDKFKYKKHTAAVFEFVRSNYTLEVERIQGPFTDRSNSKENSELFYLVEFKKECPENKITLKVDIESYSVSEAERL